MTEHAPFASGLARILRGRAGAFRRAEAVSAGYTEGQIRMRIASRRWRVLRDGVYADQAVVERATHDTELRHLLHAEALSLAADDIVLSHGTAARFLDLPYLYTGGTLVHATRTPEPGQSPWVDESVDVHRAALPAAHVMRIGDVTLTTPARTVADIARMTFSFRAGVVAGDGALANRIAIRKEIQDVLATMRKWPGVKQARDVLRCIDARAQNPLESLAHAVWWEYELPRPELQVWAFDTDGFVGIVDGVIGDPPVIYETDGLTKYRALGEIDTLEREKLRQERLEAAGAVVRRFGWDALWNAPERCVGRMRRGMAEATGRQRPRLRLYVGDRDTPAPDPVSSFGPALRDPANVGLELMYDGLRLVA